MDSLYSYTLDDLYDLLGHHCIVTLKDSRHSSREGFLHSVDPTSGNVILQKDQHSVVVMGHYIATLDIDRESKIPLESMEIPSVEASWLEDRRAKMIKYLEKHHIPFSEVADDSAIHVLGCARVETPYTATSVFCDNALIRKRVRDLVMGLPC
ncbi:hypothetical protein F4703DRAFT_1608295 [Phycomyces blakesleeanus]